MILVLVLGSYGQGKLGNFKESGNVMESQGILKVLQSKNKRQMKNLLKVIKTYC